MGNQTVAGSQKGENTISQWLPATVWLPKFFFFIDNRRNKFIQVWNNMRVSKWWQNFHFWVNNPFFWWTLRRLKILQQFALQNDRYTRKEHHLLCSVIRRYRKGYFCILVVGSRVIQTFFLVKWFKKWRFIEHYIFKLWRIAIMGHLHLETI